jgi:hypothetical protein
VVAPARGSFAGGRRAVFRCRASSATSLRRGRRRRRRAEADVAPDAGSTVDVVDIGEARRDPRARRRARRRRRSPPPTD